MMDDVHALKPTVFCGVPRVYDKLYAGKTIDQVAKFEFTQISFLSFFKFS